MADLEYFLSLLTIKTMKLLSDYPAEMPIILWSISDAFSYGSILLFSTGYMVFVCLFTILSDLLSERTKSYE